MGRVWRRPKTNVGRLLRKTRRELKLTQCEAAKRAGYTQAHYSRLESGARRLPMDAVWSVAAAFSIEEDLLLHAALEDFVPTGWGVHQT